MSEANPVQSPPSDLLATANQMRLDRLAVRASQALTSAGIPHVLIKGVTTARWLYDPPRHYRDVDLLVPRRRIREIAVTLAVAGIAEPNAGRLGEEASHSLVLISRDGFEVDVHVTLPTLPTPTVSEGDAFWRELEPHLEFMTIDQASIPVLDVVARTLVLAMHYVASGYEIAQVQEDFRRARAAIDDDTWEGVLQLARRLNVDRDVLAAQLHLCGDTKWRKVAPTRVQLRLSGAASSTIQWQAIRSAPVYRQPYLFVRELVASPTMLRRQYPNGSSLPRLYLRRWRVLIAAAFRQIAKRHQ